MRDEKLIQDAIVSEAIEIPSEEKRSDYVAEACGNDTELKQQVEHRIKEHFQNGGPEKSGRAPGNGKPNSEPSPKQNGANQEEHRDFPIKRVGPYKVLKQIGESASGIVFQAEQQEPVQLKVAAKLIKHGLDWRRVVAGFEAERHVLSSLEHPNIAKLLGGGKLPLGQPYLVTELVEGLPLTTYCDKHQQSLQQRLEMFVTVCKAVQYAHQKGVIHGDLKPSNVLVSHQDGKPTPKILDFGVAKAVRRRLREDDPSTGPEILGDKPEYLSPEQADPNAPDFDTRSDVYSLGVLLYELMTGTTPLTQESLKDVSMMETLRLIREEEPPAPSTRLNDSRERRESVAAKLQMKPDALVKAVRGDLDCVVKKALQKDRNNRYDTVSELARDIQRYLAKEPVEACPPGTRSQLRTVARKYSRVTRIAALILLFFFALAAASAGLTIWAWIDEHHAKQAEEKSRQDQEKAEKSEKEFKGKFHRAEDAYKEMKKERDQAREGEKKTRQTEQEAKAILDFIKSKLLAAGRPGDVSLTTAFWAGSQGKDASVRKNVTLRTAVDEAESQVTPAFADRPQAEATVREMLGLAYLNLREAAQAVKQYERSFELRKAILGDKDPDTADTRNQLAVAYRLAGRPDDASRLFHQKPDSPAHAAALAINGSLLLSQKKPTEAELILRECLTIRQKIQPEDWTTFETQSLLGESLMEQRKFVDAEPLLLAGYKGMKEHETKIPSPDKPRFTKAIERLVKLYQAWGKKGEADKWRKELETVEHRTK
jgi:serine/threonine protein kinase